MIDIFILFYRSRLLAFFKKLSPRPKRSNRNKTRTISGQSLFLYDLENKTSNEEKSGFFESEHSLLFEKITRHKSFDQVSQSFKNKNKCIRELHMFVFFI